jgi:hypothetical protein
MANNKIEFFKDYSNILDYVTVIMLNVIVNFISYKYDLFLY